MFGGLGILGFGCGEKCRAPGRETREWEVTGLGKCHCVPPQLDLRNWSGAWVEKGVVAISSISQRFQGQTWCSQRAWERGAARIPWHHTYVHTLHITHTPHTDRTYHPHTTHTTHITRTYHTYTPYTSHTPLIPYHTHTHAYTHTTLLPPPPPRTQLCLLRALGHHQQG